MPVSHLHARAIYTRSDGTVKIANLYGSRDALPIPLYIISEFIKVPSPVGRVAEGRPTFQADLSGRTFWPDLQAGTRPERPLIKDVVRLLNLINLKILSQDYIIFIIFFNYIFYMYIQIKLHTSHKTTYKLKCIPDEGRKVCTK